MAYCSYQLCIQERRFLKRELQKWYKNMIYIVGLERVAEELMGRRKLKQYEETLTQSNAANLYANQSPLVEQETSKKLQEVENQTGIKTEALDIKEETKLMTVEEACEKLEQEESQEEKDSNHISAKKEALNATTIKAEPIDWKPQDKCYFCVDGKLLKVNETGELVVEAGPVQPETDLNKHIIESDDSSSNSDTIQNPVKNIQQQFSANLIPKNWEALLKTFAGDPKMTSFESMAAQLAAFQRLPELNQLSSFHPNTVFSQIQHHLSPTTTPDLTPYVKLPASVDMPLASPTNPSGEQPLDLSAKPGGSSSVDSKNIFRAKPRVSTAPGRRTYTEEELNNALQDILSGKLGTRRAAVLYGIPRSTLRNKVYKLAIEQKRELLANNPPIAVLEGDDDDKDSDPEDDKSVSKVNSNDQIQTYLKLLENAQQQARIQQVDTNALVQSLLLANASGLSGLSTFPSFLPSSSKEGFSEFLRSLLTQPRELKVSDNGKAEVNHDTPNPLDRLSMLDLFQNKAFTNPQSSSTPDMEMDGSDDSANNSLVLKVPSVKSLFGAAGTLASSAFNKNGETSNSTPSTSPQIASALSTSPLIQGVQGSHLGHNFHRQRSESSSPPAAKFNLHDVIRQSISKNFQAPHLEDNKHSTPLMIDPMDQYHKRPSISVIKNLGGTDISRFGSNPNVTQLVPQQLSPNNTGTGGKGTRPKRGKYRNYDRDSLVEAVKAVQRGEMSVHRAGSYYGVPHSTLEYKVKERHLMRPRKREPKPQPLDSSSTSSSSIKPDIRVIDKSKNLMNSKPSSKSPFPNPNGLKMPPFLDPTMAAQLQYTSQLFWQHGNFPAMPNLDFARGTSSNNSTPFSPNAENFFTQQMLQKIQEEQQFKPPVNGNQNDSLNNNKSQRDYESMGTNGSSSFLDGIIRQSLDKKPSEISHGTLFEQLIKNTKNSIMIPNSKKRPGSPMDFALPSDVKRERVSPPQNATDTDYSSLMQNQQTLDPHESLSVKEEVNGSLKDETPDTNS